MLRTASNMKVGSPSAAKTTPRIKPLVIVPATATVLHPDFQHYGRPSVPDPGPSHYTAAESPGPGCLYRPPSVFKVFATLTITTLFRLGICESRKKVMGRFNQGERPMQNRLTITLPADRLAALRSRAEFYGLPLAELIRRAIDAGLPATLEALSTADAAQDLAAS